eukprot:gene2636-3050_t
MSEKYEDWVELCGMVRQAQQTFGGLWMLSRRILLTHWVGEAYEKLQSGSYDAALYSYFQKTGYLNTSDGSDDGNIKPEGLQNYIVPPPVPIQAAAEAVQCDVPEPICANGLITFGTLYCTYVPNMKSGHDILSPYWSDLDYRGIPSSGVAYSQHRATDRDSFSKATIQKTSTYILSNANTNFFPTLVVLITWINAAPYSSLSYVTTNKRVTFQLNLATDGEHTYAIYIYKAGAMLWQNYGRQPHVGYSMSGQFLDMVLNHTGQNSYYRFDSVVGNTGKPGEWIWNLNNAAKKSYLKMAEECRKWHKDQPDDEYVNMIRSHKDTFCPCTLPQVELDSRYRYWRGYRNIQCFRQRGMWYFRETKVSFFTACCYDVIWKYLYKEFNPELGPLTQTYITQSYHSSKLWYRYYRGLARSTAVSDDINAFSNCCPMLNLQSPIATESYCHLYAQKRPVPTCETKDYSPPIIGWSGGDPHIKTLDGFTYTFNGIGDYSLLSLKNSSDFIVHCRMSKAVVNEAKNGTLASKATVFSAFALSAFQGAVVEIYLNVTDGKNILLINKKYYNSSALNGTLNINGTDITWTNGNTTKLSIVYESGVGAVIHIFKSLLTIQVTSLPSFLNETAGLLGVYNNDMSDDLMTPNGDFLPLNSTQKSIYYEFGKLWELRGNKSLFTLNDTEYDKGFIPLFFDNIHDLFGNNTALKEKAIALCGKSSFTCLFDVMLTGDTTAASESKSTLEDFNTEQKILVTFPPKVVSPKNLVLSYGGMYNFRIEAASQFSSKLTYLVEATGIVAVSNSTSGNFSLQVNSTDFTLKFIVRDGRGLATQFIPAIRLCYCLNGSSCNTSVENSLASSSNVYLTYAKCNCKYGLKGSFCQYIDRDYCGMHPCFPGVNCTNNVINEVAECDRCPLGYVGDGRNCYDIDECTNATHNCDQNATCRNVPGTFQCTCNAGFTGNGSSCYDVDECSSNTHNCHAMATCTNKLASFDCKCNANFTGNGTFCKDIDQCTHGSHNCHSNATCLEKDIRFGCKCNSGYHGNGSYCQDIDECHLRVHDCHENATCTNTHGRFSCTCKYGFTGNGTTCKDVDECRSQTHNCDQRAKCVNMLGGYICNCNDGFMGDGRSCADVDECKLTNQDCHESASCINILGSYECQCKKGYYGNGKICQDINECKIATHNCSDNAKCSNVAGGFKCTCRNGFHGDGYACKDVNECEQDLHDCNKNAICINLQGGFNCRCKDGFIRNGSSCEEILQVDVKKNSMMLPNKYIILVAFGGLILIVFVFGAVIKRRTVAKKSRKHNVTTSGQINNGFYGENNGNQAPVSPGKMFEMTKKGHHG